MISQLYIRVHIIYLLVFKIDLSRMKGEMFVNTGTD